jgi:hypothetical protein
MKNIAYYLFIAMVFANRSLFAQGFITGDSSGNERVVSVFDRRYGQVWQTVTGASGRFRSPSLDAGEYLAVCQGIITPIIVRDDRAAEVLFASQTTMSIDFETWSPARKKFGQTFRATGPWVNGFTFWNPGKPLPLIAELRETDSTGKLISKFDFGNQPVHWIKIVDLQPGQWPTVQGNTYYLSIASIDGQTFRLGTPAIGNAYPDGQAYYDDVPMLDSDMGFLIRQDADNLTTTVRVSLHQGLGFKAEGPASGSTPWAAQSFVATTKNIRSVWFNAGWSGAEGIKHAFVVSIHVGSPTGKRVGPERVVHMIKDWGATAVWFADQVPVQPGRRYAVRFRRQDGKPLYAYLAADIYAQGKATRGELNTPDMDLTCIVRGEKMPGSVFLPYNIALTEVTPTTTTVQWETAVATTSRLQLQFAEGNTKTISHDAFTKQHLMKLKDLRPGSKYTCRVGGAAQTNPDRIVLSKSRDLATLHDPTMPGRSSVREQSSNGKLIPLVNPSFEQNLQGWKRSPLMRGMHKMPLPDEIGNASALFYLDRYTAHSGKHVLGWQHRVHVKSGIVPRKLEPAVSQLVYQTVKTVSGRDYILSAWICTDERQGGWNRNDRVRLIVDPTSSGKLASTVTVDEKHATQWYTTRGTWRQYRLKFRAVNSSTDVGVQLCQWWMLAENHIYVDDVELCEF